MNIQIDTTLKTIKIEGGVKLSEMITTLDKLFPDKEWESYSLEDVTVINNWSNPIIIDRWPNYYPWWQQPITIYSGDITAVDWTDGTYNISFQSN